MLNPDEESQFFQLHKETAQTLFGKSYRMCRGREPDAHDAVQATYLKALESWEVVSGLKDLQRKAWLITTLTREVRQMWRAARRFHETASQEIAAGEPDLTSAKAFDAVEDRDELDWVCAAMSRIEGRPGDVMFLHFMAAYPIAEVAEILAIKASTARVHLHEGRMRLRKILDGEEGS